MLGEQAGEVPDVDKPFAFSCRPLWHRIAIVSAGPTINLLFAFLIYWVVFMIGVPHIKPVIGGGGVRITCSQGGICCRRSDSFR